MGILALLGICCVGLSSLLSSFGSISEERFMLMSLSIKGKVRLCC